MKKTHYYVSYDRKKQSWIVKSVYLYTTEELIKENIDSSYLNNHTKSLITIAPVGKEIFTWDTNISPLNEEVYENIQPHHYFVFDNPEKLKTALSKLIELHFNKENEEITEMEKVLQRKRAKAEQKHFRLNILLNENETKLPVDFITLSVDLENGGLLIT